jgi:hypothetical protein
LPKVAKASLSCLLFWSRACVTAAYFIVQSHFILFTPFHPLRWVSFRFVHFSRFSQCRLPTFQLACIVVRAAVNGRLFFASTIPTLKNKPTHCPCVSIVWLKLRQMIYLFCHTCHIVCIRPRRSSSCSHAAHTHSTRRGLATQRIANHFIPFHYIHFLQPFPTASRRRFSLYLSFVNFLL